MKFNVYFRLRGPVGENTIAAKNNPIETGWEKPHQAMQALLRSLLDRLPHDEMCGLDTVGLVIEPADGNKTPPAGTDVPLSLARGSTHGSGHGTGDPG